MLLAAFMEQPRAWQHGYGLCTRTRLKSGTLYPILMRLADRNFLTSNWQPAEQAGRPPRHMYRLTAQGVAFARAQLQASPAPSWPATTQRAFA